ncbi:MAG TPA: PLP-dependent aspartate aminotransferase family protein [Thermoplasmata archaeon]|nr:PLP-dependent aspartate aminotransferase family protein [Thermoplasmata archaeon]
MRFDTRAVHDGQPVDPATGAVNTPVYLSSTFVQEAPNRNKGWVYSRSGNPTRSVLENALARLESGATGLAFSSGLGAMTTLLDDFPSGSRVLAGRDLYGGSWRLLEHRRRQFGIVPVYVDFRDLDQVEAALRAGPTALVYGESPTNPLMQLCDLRAIARLAHRHRARFVVDNTFASPALQRPLELGADAVLHSTTKYLGGHSDIVGGALVAHAPEWGERLRWLQNALGAVPSPMDAFLTLRGIKTLGLRMRRHSEGAQAVAEELEGSRKVRAVYYPGLRSHPQFALGRRQMSRPGGMLSFELKNATAARRFLSRLELFALAESLGGVESLAEHPASMTHASIPRRERTAQGISDGLIRLSCGIEDPADLVAEVRGALRSV